MCCRHYVLKPTIHTHSFSVRCPAFKLLTYYGGVKERAAKRQGWSKPNAFHVCITSYTLVLQVGAPAARAGLGCSSGGHVDCPHWGQKLLPPLGLHPAQTVSLSLAQLLSAGAFCLPVPVLLQDARMFKRKKWKYLILDEAHMIKNWKSQRWQVHAACLATAKVSWALLA